MPDRLADRTPEVGADRLLAELTPPPRFRDVRFSTYVPDPHQHSQGRARHRLEKFATRMHEKPSRRFLRRRAATVDGHAGVYLDGGYGVGKTHLLASLWHAAPEPKAYATFVELTNLVGALGFGSAVDALSSHRLVCVDEFELDDPGDTVLVSTFLGKLVEAGVHLGATSNTLPEKLGEGRFATADFLREIQGLSAHFEPIRIDGDDYRHRGLPDAPAPVDDDALTAALQDRPGATLDDFSSLCTHLASLHPSRYGALLDGVSAVGLSDVRPVDDQATALRLVVFVDRLYDREVPVLASGASLDSVFPDEFLHGGYRKKYLRAVSRLVALSRDAHAG